LDFREFACVEKLTIEERMLWGGYENEIAEPENLLPYNLKMLTLDDWPSAHQELDGLNILYEWITLGQLPNLE
jgi:hypothetical protein